MLSFVQLRTGAFLPLREIRKCVPEFSALNMIFLYLTDYTEEKEIKNRYRWSHKVELCNFNTSIFFNVVAIANECTWAWRNSSGPRTHWKGDYLSNLWFNQLQDFNWLLVLIAISNPKSLNFPPLDKYPQPFVSALTATSIPRKIFNKRTQRNCTAEAKYMTRRDSVFVWNLGNTWRECNGM